MCQLAQDTTDSPPLIDIARQTTARRNHFFCCSLIGFLRYLPLQFALHDKSEIKEVFVFPKNTVSSTKRQDSCHLPDTGLPEWFYFFKCNNTNKKKNHIPPYLEAKATLKQCFKKGTHKHTSAHTLRHLLLLFGNFLNQEFSV